LNAFDTFVNPPYKYTLIPFWFLNDDLDETELIRQIDDFAAHGVYGFIPHARMGLPKSIGFMSDRWLHFTKICVDRAARNGMVVVLYDEGMYPSGSCAGQVVAANPRFATRCLARREKGTLGDDELLVAENERFLYVNRPSNGHIRGVHFGTDDGEPGAPASADLLNRDAMAAFRHLVLDGHYDTLKEHFGKTIIGVFTDEPDLLGRGHDGGVRPWTWEFESYLEHYLGYDMRPHCAALFDRDHPDHDRRVHDFFRAVNARLEEVYYAPYGKWCEDHGIALTGHPAGPDDIGMLRHFQIPGQDVVWRYVEPLDEKSIEGAQSTMAKCSWSAQVHFGRSRNANECFGAYGWNFTEDEMWWVTNWLLVRGVNMLFPHAFYYSIRGSRRDERPPDVGPNNVWWDRYNEYADYCRRLCWLLAEGELVCDTLILGTPTSLPWRAARALFEAQRDFLYLDTKTLRSAKIGETAIRVGSAAYSAVVIDGPGFADAETFRLLQPMIDGGRVIAYVDPLPEVPHLAPDASHLVAVLDEIAPRDVRITPPNAHLRFIHVRHDSRHYYLFANEGQETIEGRLEVSARGAGEWWDPRAAGVVDGAPADRIALAPYETRVLSVGG